MEDDSLTTQRGTTETPPLDAEHCDYCDRRDIAVIEFDPADPLWLVYCSGHYAWTRKVLADHKLIRVHPDFDLDAKPIRFT